MKTFSFFILSMISIAAYAQSPITLTRADFPRPTAASTLPDSVLYTNAVGATTSQNTAGSSATWNEAGLTGTTAYQNYVAMSATPLVFQLVFLSCDFAQPLLNGVNIGTGGLTDAYEYYNYAAADSRLEIKGLGGNLTIPPSTTGIPTPVLYSSPDVLYQFPIAFGNTDSSNSAFDISLPLPAPIGTVQVKRKQKRVNNVDAWGSITTPAGTFDVLRVVSNIQRVDSIITALFPFGLPSNIVEYKWLGAGKKLPVLQVNGNIAAGTFTPTTTTFWGQGPSALSPSVINHQSLVVYPNPAISNCAIDFELSEVANVDFYINDIQGKRVGEFHFAKQSAGKHNEVLPIAQLLSGHYTITIKANNYVLTSKLLKL